MQSFPTSDAIVLRKYRSRIPIFLACVVLITGLITGGYQALNTMQRLEVLESERDRWQRPAEVIQSLNLKEGNVVVDLGSGAGYFALKLSGVVGEHGKVLAVDIRRLPLMFLRIRALLRNQHNVTIFQGQSNNPNLPALAMDAVLVANTYHELANAKSILGCIFQSLKSGGRLVIVDRGPRSGDREARAIEAQHHELPPALVEGPLRQTGFEIISRQDRFIDQPDNGLWWLIVARKP